MATLDQDDLNNIAAAVWAAAPIGATGELSIGNGLGSREYIDFLTGVDDEPIAKAMIRVFPYDNGAADFTQCKARTITESDGRFVMWLDPGSYVMRVEKVSTLVYTKIFTVTAPLPSLGVYINDSVDVT